MVTIKLKRILTHLWSGERPLRRAFPASALRQIEQAIQRSEASHSGELRFVVEAALDIGPLWAGTSAADRALELFSQLRIWDTEQNNGVLIYLLLAERDVEIIADRGIHRRVGSAGWAQICRMMEQAFGRGAEECLVPGAMGVDRGIALLGTEGLKETHGGDRLIMPEPNLATEHQLCQQAAFNVAQGMAGTCQPARFFRRIPNPEHALRQKWIGGLGRC